MLIFLHWVWQFAVGQSEGGCVVNQSASPPQKLTTQTVSEKAIVLFSPRFMNLELQLFFIFHSQIMTYSFMFSQAWDTTAEM